MNNKFYYLLLLAAWCSFALQAMDPEHRKTIESLLASGVTGEELNKKIDCWIPLSIAAYDSQDIDLLKALLKKGADPNAVGCNTSLNSAVMAGNVDGIRLLLEYGANPDIRVYSTCTPLGWAASKGFSEIVQLLLHYKANINKQSSAGYTALMGSVAELVHGSSKEDIKKCIKLLLYHGADPTIQATYGWAQGMNALDVARENGLNDVVQWLQNPLTKEQAKENRILLLSRGCWEDNHDIKHNLFPRKIAKLITSYLNEFPIQSHNQLNNDNNNEQ